MRKEVIDLIIADLGKTLLLEPQSFEAELQRMDYPISKDDQPYLRIKLHNPPPVHPDINEKELRPGEWMAICQQVIFELIYRFGLGALDWIRSIAFGEYDWTQANALLLLCRLYLDGKLSDDIITEIDSRLPRMRHEAILNFAGDLVRRRDRDERFGVIIKKIKNVPFRLALAEIGHNEPMTREELISLGRRILAAEGSDTEIVDLMELFDKNVPHPNGSSLFYYPENHSSEEEYDPTVEEIVDKCLKYKD